MGFKQIGFLIALLLCSFTSAQGTYEAVSVGNLRSITRYLEGFYYEGSIYLCGGMESQYLVYTSDIQRLDLTTGDVTVVGSFPYTVAGGGLASAGNGTHYYMSGNRHFLGAYTGHILRIDEANPAATPVIVGQLPKPLSLFEPASDGAGNIYIVGGHYRDVDGEPHFSDEVLKYDSHLNSFKVVTQFPYEMSGASTAWVKDSLYVFSRFGLIHSIIWKYDSVSGEGSIGNLPFDDRFPYASTQTVVVGSDIYLVGGSHYEGREHLFLYKFDTITETGELLNVTNINYDVSDGVVVYVGSLQRIYVVGGVWKFDDVPADILYIQL